MLQKRHFISFINIGLCFLLSLGLSACGGGDDSSTNEPVPNYQIEYLKTLTRDEISKAFDSQQLQIPTAALQYDVKLYRISYTTLNNQGADVTASGLLAVPQKAAVLASTLLSFQHATIFYNSEAPSNDLTGHAPPIVIASLGYMTLAADYVGYGVSAGHPHPYLMLKPSAQAVHDLIKVGYDWLKKQNITLNNKLALTGYSEGGYVTMAAHQALEQEPITGLTLVASLPAAGPYHLSATLDFFLDSLNPFSKVDTAGARNLPDGVSEWLTKLLMGQLIPDDSDVVFDNTVIYNYIDAGVSGVEAYNVYDWKALKPVYLFHGREDETVPFLNATDALTAMTAKGSTQVTLRECSASPSTHKGCVPEYGAFVYNTLLNLGLN
ncbi:alpha/beta hydrolase family protein [Thiolinea disciformis]|uniref:alpha/beta hydrolase family protein n=1 Tax=Thiolinea disciformis TaxID=125614 RepID=UPI00037549DD|nr:prolyl oligopeptidase family serine peptidase [Thiolinea disciformis]